MIATLLEEYNHLVTDCRDLLEREISEYLAGRGGQDPSILDRKQDLIKQLDSRLGDLKAARAAAGDSPMVNREQVHYLQQTFMQLLSLDRQLERHLLSKNIPPKVEQVKVPHQPQFAASLYRQNQGLAGATKYGG